MNFVNNFYDKHKFYAPFADSPGGGKVRKKAQAIIRNRLIIRTISATQKAPTRGATESIYRDN